MEIKNTPNVHAVGEVLVYKVFGGEMLVRVLTVDNQGPCQEYGVKVLVFQIPAPT